MSSRVDAEVLGVPAISRSAVASSRCTRPRRTPRQRVVGQRRGEPRVAGSRARDRRRRGRRATAASDGGDDPTADLRRPHPGEPAQVPAGPISGAPSARCASRTGAPVARLVGDGERGRASRPERVDEIGIGRPVRTASGTRRAAPAGPCPGRAGSAAWSTSRARTTERARSRRASAPCRRRAGRASPSGTRCSR